MRSLAALIPFLPMLSFVVYGLLALASLRERPSVAAGSVRVDDLTFVFVVPCLNEERVIAASLDRLLTLPQRNWQALVVDDGSDDDTADIVRRYQRADDRIHLLQRIAPEARHGKGAALNAAYRHLRASSLLGGCSHGSDAVIVVILDADGRLRQNALATVAPQFTRPDIAAVQVGVRMYNRAAGWLARMQDMEFLVFTEVFQRARQRYGNAGLGGNGQFVRLSALESLGAEPWTHFLTEDLDMGLRLQASGWRTSFTPDTYVSQQGLTRLRPLMRQRTRWYQGHLQCWSRIPDLLNSRHLSVGRTVDLLVYLVSPKTVLLISLSLAAYLPGLAARLLSSPDPAAGMSVTIRLSLLLWYTVVFSVIPLVGYVYWRAAARSGPETTLRRAMGYAVLFSLYAYIWLPVGWWASWRLLRGHRGWAKTLRLVDEPAPAGASASSPLGTPR
jgi:cellulose synthase/poly-beta-1,6-N-acetylglucosamine synthase-like glycosyltransferase